MIRTIGYLPFILLCVSCSHLSLLASDEIFVSKADAYLNPLVEKDEFAGTVLVAKNGRTVFSKGYGLANREHEVRTGVDTKYRLGSVTKQFTAMVVLLLEKEQKIDTSDQVSDYIEDCPDSWSDITVHHLLNHTSGIPSFTDFDGNIEFERLPTTVRATVDRFIHLPLEFPPGTKFHYSDSGYVLLGYIIERIVGRSYEDFITERIFNPLGMEHTGYDRPETILPHRAAGYSKRGDEIVNCIHFAMDTPHAAGALYSTVEDLLTWNQSLTAATLVSRQAVDKMFLPYDGEYGDGWWENSGQYCYGWFRKSWDNRVLFEHPGSISGFQTDVIRCPGDKVYIAVLSNCEWADAEDVASHLGRMFFANAE